MNSKRTIVGLVCLFLVVVFGALSLYSYRRLLAFEHMFMPDQSNVLAAFSERRVSFGVFTPLGSTWLPTWTVSYRDRDLPLADTDPSLSVDLLGHVAGSTSKEVSTALEIYKRQHQ